jgi:hypothetical protein
MMYLLTPEVHAQLVGALWVVVEHNKLHHGENSNTVLQCTPLLAMLKAMQPVEPSLFSVTYGGAHTNNFHRGKENADDEMQRLERNFPEPVNKRKVAALYTTVKD